MLNYATIMLCAQELLCFNADIYYVLPSMIRVQLDNTFCTITVSNLYTDPGFAFNDDGYKKDVRYHFPKDGMYDDPRL